ncbi:TPR-like protein [Penicillium chermesinum]|uniref:TPR-like protein n=1 Tax=Penicillium chermesinum TaxID=63820 RepID=A0A9W9PHT4_9EURO|nr:TPR-like protein [Penicillium chermesinum]KAJ5247096.1 TPR-like protein [Penicillium chermesinum]KAJ6145343.1 TPR-like protein [Penicillium chermesinum]
MSETYFNLGSYHCPVTTSSPQAQAWFDRGLIWSYAFNHEEAIACFQRAIDADPTCAMAYWGLAYAIGPNYNKPWGFFDEKELKQVVYRGYHAAQSALAHIEQASPLEAAFVKAIQARYPDEVPVKTFEEWNASFAEEMKSVQRDFPQSLDVATIYADALMNLKPWQLWSLETGEPTEGAPTLEVKQIIDDALAGIPGALGHPGLLHLYIHLMEMSPSPESALPIANRLRGLVPDGGHLQHMPTHLDILCGKYEDAITWNTAAIAADEKYVKEVGPLNFYTLYRSHDYHFCVYAAMFSGKFQVAIDTTAKLEASIPESLLRVESPPMADWLEAFLSLRAHVLIRFGRWDDIISLQIPENQGLYAMTTAITHYAKGVAFAAKGNVDEASNQQQLFEQAVGRVPESRTLFNNTCLDILAIAREMLKGELLYRQRLFDAAFESLRSAIHLEDNLPYDEPWGWMQPTRHAYGALLLEQGHVEQSLEVYRADLGLSETLPRALRHPNNVWGLHGAHECFLKLGRDAEARDLEPLLSRATAGADVPIYASCFCRRADGHQGSVTCGGRN